MSESTTQLTYKTPSIASTSSCYFVAHSAILILLTVKAQNTRWRMLLFHDSLVPQQILSYAAQMLKLSELGE